MEDFERQGGVAFLLIYFARENKYYYMRFKELVKFWNRSKTGHAKSVKFTELDMDYMISVKGYYIQYLPPAAKRSGQQGRTANLRLTKAGGLCIILTHRSFTNLPQ